MITLVLGMLLMTAFAHADEVAFPTGDGGVVHADLYGTGGRGVVLAHGMRFDKASWKDQATQLASAGFRELFLAGRKIGRKGGRLVVCSLRGEVKRVFELARFDTAYPIFETRQLALDHLKAPKA